jgi:hypothetical protein
VQIGLHHVDGHGQRKRHGVDPLLAPQRQARPQRELETAREQPEHRQDAGRRKADRAPQQATDAADGQRRRQQEAGARQVGARVDPSRGLVAHSGHEHDFKERRREHQRQERSQQRQRAGQTGIHHPAAEHRRCESQCGGARHTRHGQRAHRVGRILSCLGWPPRNEVVEALRDTQLRQAVERAVDQKQLLVGAECRLVEEAHQHDGHHEHGHEPDPTSQHQPERRPRGRVQPEQRSHAACPRGCRCRSRST